MTLKKDIQKSAKTLEFQRLLTFSRQTYDYARKKGYCNKNNILRPHIQLSANTCR